MPGTRAASQSCPSDELLGAFAEGRLPRTQLRRVGEHLRGCDACCELVERYASAWQLGAAPLATLSQSGEETHEPTLLQPGQRFGRYVLLHLAGVGGMGEVHAAYDPVLDRKVALKLLHARAGADRRAQALQEARTIAAIEHPHIVAIYDVGHAHGRDYIAMELVEGGTLVQWLVAAPREPSAILEVFRQAGHGLAAAHRHGVVHRDFKPANVLVGCDRDGRVERVRVADFGLAAPRGAPASRAGTRGYVAPEQAAGAAPDPRADQYSFCIALGEALGNDGPAITESAPAPSAAPQLGASRSRRVARVIARGTAEDPARRWPSMAALLDALVPAPRPRRWLVALGAVAVATTPLLLGSQPEACVPTQALASELWSDDVRTRTAEAFAASGLPFAATAWTNAQGVLAAEIEAWAVHAHAACTSDDLAALACAEQRRTALEQAIVVLADADATTITHAAAVVAELEGDACDATAPTGPQHPRLLAALAAAKALNVAGHPLAARSKLEQAIDDARASGDEAVLREAQLELASILPGFGEEAAASSMVAEVAYAALAAGDDRLAARALVHLVLVDGAQRSDLEAAARWDRDATAVLARLGDPPRERAALERARGAIAIDRNDGLAAIAPLRAALAWAESERGPEALKTATALRDLGVALFLAEQLDEAALVVARAQAIREAQLGAEHPEVAAVLDLRFAIERAHGEHEAAVATARRALAIHERTQGPDHLSTLAARLRLGLALEEIDLEASRAATAAALAGYERVVGVGHAHTENARYNLAQADLRLRAYESAFAEAELAHAGLLALYGDDHPHVGAAAIAAGNALRALGRLGEARRWIASALAHTTDAPAVRRAVASDALAAVEYDAGDRARAATLWDAGAEAWTEAYGPEHPDAKQSRSLARTARAELRQLTRPH